MKPISLAFGAALMTLTAAQAMAEMSPADRTFATNAAAGGLAEVSLGQLATQNAASPTVRQFGQQMVTDHTQANTELMQIGKQANLTLPAKPAAADHAKEEKLRATKGAAFDTAYITDMIQDHQKDVADFGQEADSGTDPALKAFAKKYLPVVQHHLQMAQAAKTGS